MKWSNQPGMLSWFYFLGIFAAIAFCALGVFLGKKYPVRKCERKSTTIIFITEMVLVTIELFKQIFLAASNSYYDWNNFPFQICSMIVYVLPILLISKNELEKEAVQGFIVFFCLAGAVFYFFKPAAALKTPYILISLQSFLWHWLIIGIGSFIVSSYELFKKKQLHILLGGYALFITIAILAAIIDYNAYLKNPNLGLNYFYIAYGQKPFYPILNLIFTTYKPYFLYFGCFIIYFGIGALAIYGISVLVHIVLEKVFKFGERRIEKAPNSQL